MMKKLRELPSLTQLQIVSITILTIVVLHSWISPRGISLNKFFILLALASIYYVIGFLLKRKWISLRLSDILTIVFTPIIIVAMLIVLLFASFDAATTAVTDPNEYQKIMFFYRLRIHERVQHFPTFIPKNAKNVQFFELPQFMQGGNELLLSMSLDDKELDLLEKQLTPKAIYVVPIQEATLDNSLDMTSFIDLELSDDTVFYTLHHESFSDYFNHALCYGAIIDRANNTIVYYYSRW